MVILPAFGVTMAMLQQLERRGCTLIDTTCGSVLNVWKNVRRYAEERLHRRSFTARCGTRKPRRRRRRPSSTAAAISSCSTIARRRVVCDYIRTAAIPAAVLARFPNAVSPGFDPDRDLQRIGLANQTTMLMSESLAIGEMFKAAMIDR